MKFIFVLIMISLPMFAQDAVIVSAASKLEVFDATTMNYLGKFSDIKKDRKVVLTPSALLQLKSGDLVVAGGASAHQFNGKYVTMIKIGPDGEIKELMVKQESKRRDRDGRVKAPISSPRRILELTNGDLLVLDSTGTIDRFSSTGESKGDFFAEGVEKADDETIQDIVLYDGQVAVISYKTRKKLISYNEDGTLGQKLDTGNDAIRTPLSITQLKNKKYLLIDTKNVVILDSELTYEKQVITEGLMKPTFILENQETGNIVIIDEGRDRGGLDSYDDNLEIFIDGKYQGSKGTYKDGTLRTMTYFKGLTKTFK